MKTAYRKTQQEVWNKDGGKQGIGKIFISHRKGMVISIDIEIKQKSFFVTIQFFANSTPRHFEFLNSI